MPVLMVNFVYNRGLKLLRGKIFLSTTLVSCLETVIDGKKRYYASSVHSNNISVKQNTI